MAARRLPLQSEASFAQQVVDLAGRLRWRVYRTWKSQHSPAGFPDLCMVRRPRVVFAELKRQDKSPTPEQQAWLDDLRACGHEAYLFRPSDFEEIVRILR